MYNNSFTIKSTNGKFNYLDKSYQNLIIKNTKLDVNLERWEIYSKIIDKVIEIAGPREFKNIKYRLTGGDNPNDVMFEMIEKYSDKSVLLQSLEIFIRNFSDEDWINRFYS